VRRKLSLLKTAVTKIYVIITMKLICKKPKKTDILIYDRVGSEFIRRSLGKGKSWGILDVRGKTLNLYPPVLFYIISTIIGNFFVKSTYWKSINFRMAAELAAIKLIQPKLVITFVDNSRRFNFLSRIYLKATFIGVQNGLRGIEVADMAEYLCQTNFFCFGEETKKRYQTEGCQIGRYVVGGSLKEGLYREVAPSSHEKKYDFCWISQYRPERFEKTMPELRHNSLQLLEFIQKYCTENNKSLAIACSCKEKTFPYEYRFLLRVIQMKGVYLVPNDDDNFSSYRLIDQSRVSLTTNSTIGFESVSRGNKVLFCNFTNDEYYDVPSGYADGIWSLRGSGVTYDEFRDRLAVVSELSNTEWLQLTQNMAQFFVQGGDQPLPQQILREEIDRVLLNDPV